MVHPGVTFAIVVGVAVTTALYYLFTQNNPERTRAHRARPGYDDDGGDEDYRSPWDRPSASLPNASSRASSRRTTRATSPAGSSDSCTICLENLAGANCFRVACGHRFHRLCINEWLKCDKVCPNCRAPIWL